MRLVSFSASCMALIVNKQSVGSSTPPSSVQNVEETASPGVLVARGSAEPNSSGAGGTFSAAPASPRAQRPARPSTVRESSRRVQRWSSVDEGSLNGNSPGDEDGRRQWRHAGSAESPLGGREGRSVVGEGLRAAGLAKRGSEDVFAEGVSQRRVRTGDGLGNRPTSSESRDGELEELRRGVTRVGLGLSEEKRDLRTPATPSSPGRYGTTRNIYDTFSASSSRAATSLASYGAEEGGSRTAPPPLRSYRSSYVPQERTLSRHTPQHERSRTSPFGRNTPQHVPFTPSSEHGRLMLDSLAMFESQLSRVPSPVLMPDLFRAAQSVVQSANGLNTLLRSGNAHALKAQIEAEVGDAEALVDASEVWRQVGGEYRESLRVSDELVRTVTALLLGVGRLVKEAVKERGAGSPDMSGGGGGGSGRLNLDEDERERDRQVRSSMRSVEANGRSVEGSAYRESRRSWENTDASRRVGLDLNSRPSTSLSMARDRDRRTMRQDDVDETTRERERSSALEGLTTRRMFTPRTRDTTQASPASPDSLDPNYPSPTPAPRSTERDYRVLHHSLPPLTVPPPLPSLPSESLLDRKNSTKGRRAKMSNTSNATVRGLSIFPTINSPNPTTALTTHTVSAAGGEVTGFPLLRAEPSPSTALSELQQQQDRDGRKRTVSAATVSDLEGTSGSSGSSKTHGLKSSRVRMSLDSGTLESAPQARHLPSQRQLVNGDRRERRRTINEAFP